MNKFHLRARALILDHDNDVLLAHRKGANNTYLPGGHVEIGESAAAALKREIREEIGKEIIINQFLGCIESDWEQEGLHNYELNLIFLSDFKNKNIRHVKSLEDHIEFFWCPSDKLEKNNLLPATLLELIPQYLSGVESIWWESTLG